MQARIIAYSAALAFYAVTMLAVAIDARAHGDASWIAANSRYVDVEGTHCCGPSDCRREHATKFREAPDGIYVTTGAGNEVLMPRSLAGAGLYPSIDRDWWICVRGGVVRCIFKPTTEGRYGATIREG
jgi:hypothetical protein